MYKRNPGLQSPTTATLVNFVTAGSCVVRKSFQLPLLDLAISPLMVPCFLFGFLSDRAT